MQAFQPRQEIRNATIGVCLALSMVGCAMSGQAMKAPAASALIEAPSGTAIETVLACAEKNVQELARADSVWDTRITRKDLVAGVLESGNYPEENESGFRVSVRFDAASREVAIGIKGAGAYFIDLGVDAAMTEFKSRLSDCIASSRHVPSP